MADTRRVVGIGAALGVLLTAAVLALLTIASIESWLDDREGSLGAIASIVTIVGLAATVVAVTIGAGQLRQTRVATRATALYGAMKDFRQESVLLLPSLACSDTTNEAAKRAIQMYASLYELHDAGVFADEDWKRVKVDAATTAGAFPAMGDEWPRVKDGYSKAFRDEMSDIW